MFIFPTTTPIGIHTVATTFEVEAPQGVNFNVTRFPGGINGTVYVNHGTYATVNFGHLGGGQSGLTVSASTPQGWRYCFAQTVVGNAFLKDEPGELVGTSATNGRSGPVVSIQLLFRTFRLRFL